MYSALSTDSRVTKAVRMSDLLYLISSIAIEKNLTKAPDGAEEDELGLPVCKVELHLSLNCRH